MYDLALGLEELRQDVTVVCPSESKLPDGVKHLDIGPAKYQVQQNWVEAEKQPYEKYKPLLKKADVTNDHTWAGWPYMAKQEDNALKIVHTHHGHMNWRTPPPVKHANLVAISQYMEKLYSVLLGLPVRHIYNGVALEDYALNPKRGDRLIYVGRIAKFKQPHLAIDIAKRAGVPLDVVGGDRFVDDLGYVERVKDQCDGVHARYIGEVPPDLKLKYLQNSRAILITSHMGEPFGLVAVEALATGRPVICLDDGALKEIVNPSVGFVCQTPDEIVKIVQEGKDLTIAAEQCRRRAEEFSRQKMAQAYLELYKRVLNGDEW